MATKAELLQKIEESPIKSFTKEIVKSYINSLSGNAMRRPDKLKAGDVFLNHLNGGKNRPIVIVAIQAGVVFGIPLSTTEDVMNMTISKSRFFGKGWFGKSLVTVKEEVAMDYFVGMYDNPAVVKKAKLALKQLINDVL